MDGVVGEFGGLGGWFAGDPRGSANLDGGEEASGVAGDRFEFGVDVAEEFVDGAFGEGLEDGAPADGTATAFGAEVDDSSEVLDVPPGFGVREHGRDDRLDLFDRFVKLGVEVAGDMVAELGREGTLKCGARLGMSADGDPDQLLRFAEANDLGGDVFEVLADFLVAVPGETRL